MKQMTEYNRVSGYLNKIFTLLNETHFENALSKPVITIQSTPKAYGHVTVAKVWSSDEDERHELNIGAGTLTRPIENVVATMLHEIEAHEYNDSTGKCDMCGCDKSVQAPDDPDKKGGLGAGAIVGIVLGSLAVLGGGGFALYWFVLRKKPTAPVDPTSPVEDAPKADADTDTEKGAEATDEDDSPEAEEEAPNAGDAPETEDKKDTE